MITLTPKMLEAWFNLMSEAMHGSSDEQHLMKALSGSTNTSEETMRMMMRFMPPGMGPLQPEAFNEWMEEWWRMMGVVPRHRYLELLERYELLRTRLEESERTSRRLQSMIGEKRQEEAQKVLDFWGSSLEETLKAQADWMRAWMPDASKNDDEPAKLHEPEKAREPEKVNPKEKA